MDNKFTLDLSTTSPEVRAAMIDAASRVYAAGLAAANSSSEDIRRRTARGDIKDFFSALESMRK